MKRKLKILYYYFNYKLAWFTHPNTPSIESEYKYKYYNAKYSNIV